MVVEKYQEGDVIDGTVVRIAPFGAFVEIQPGVDGLVHISQLANRRVEKPQDVVSVNQPVKVKILSIDPQEKRIGLSIREVAQDLEEAEVREYLDQQETEPAAEQAEGVSQPEAAEPAEPVEVISQIEETDSAEQE